MVFIGQMLILCIVSALTKLDGSKRRQTCCALTSCGMWVLDCTWRKRLGRGQNCLPRLSEAGKIIPLCKGEVLLYIFRD